jgi:outer membrane autotransporter protein
MGRYTDFDDDSASADRDGHLWSFTSGLSYALSEQTTVGAFTRVRKGEVDSKALDASLDSDFFGGGVYLATTLGNGVRVMVAGAVEGGDSDIVISGDSGSFDTDEKTLEARIDKRFTKGRHWIEPALKALYSDMERDGYTDSAGAFVSASDITLGRLTFGPTIGTTIQSGTTTIKPFARINGVWDFENQDDFTLSTGEVVSSADIALNLGGGLEIAFDSGVVVAAAADWFSFNDDLDSVTVTGSIGMPLSALGLGGIASAGLVSLDFSGNQSDASAQARLRIPLGGK